ncbi:TauD/TfdA family dioxygenase [Myxococcus faecalis]|jgi:alpha-ketoglutarate-dependent taurine dioxygenase|uniref:TauD/TfdA dioxygenase family protein n=1 Tax=Myxococcus TaxID=32 RepID=UPI001143EE3B|nr:TauD/TfdA family dioxygenase [Myxococcus sp. AB025B]
MTLRIEPFGSGSGRLVHREGPDDILQLPAEELIALFKSAGLVIFRGFTTSPQVMHDFAGRFSTRFNRDRLRPVVAGSDGYVQMVTEGMGYVEPHAEQANSPFRPDALWFCCSVPAAEGGETLAWDGVRLWEKLRPELKQLFRNKKLRFFQRYSNDKWQRFMGNGATLADVQTTLDGIEGVSYYVSPDDSIYLEYVCPAVVKTRYGGQDAFANSLLSERKNTLGDLMSFDDGSAISDDIVSEVQEAMKELEDAIAWHPGDLAFIDNSRYLHGRNAYTDTRRKIFSSLSFLNF